MLKVFLSFQQICSFHYRFLGKERATIFYWPSPVQSLLVLDPVRTINIFLFITRNLYVLKLRTLFLTPADLSVGRVSTAHIYMLHYAVRQR
jgi:hypothetical protein